MSSDGIAAMLTATKGPVFRWPRLWMASATNSFPVPDSPRISAVRSFRSSRATMRYTSCIAGLRPTIGIVASRSVLLSLWLSALRFSIPCLTARTSSSRSNGLGKYSNALISLALTAVSSVFCADMMMIGMSGHCAITSSRLEMPSRSLSTTSVSIRS